ncbi:MAG: amino acid ABC transporter substrate-binding protein [Desulfobacteraceae bacterium]|nr:amino acid ABC transporter substrate-binding protein [Desulfobacteraceae bacterium]
MTNHGRIHIILSALIGFCFITFNIVLVQAGQELPISVSEFPPFEFTKDNKVVGIDTEIIKQVLKRLGYVPKIKMLPWKRALLMTQKGEFAGIYSLTKTPEREKDYHFSNQLTTVRDVFFKLKKNNIEWSALDDLKDFRIGASSGYGYPPEFMTALKEKKFKQIQMLNGDDLELRHLKRLIIDRIDMAICEVSVCQYLIKIHAPEFDTIDFIDTTIGEERGYYIGFSKLWPGAQRIAKDFNDELAKFIAQGKRKKIFKKYGITSSLN